MQATSAQLANVLNANAGGEMRLRKKEEIKIVYLCRIRVWTRRMSHPTAASAIKHSIKHDMLQQI